MSLLTAAWISLSCAALPQGPVAPPPARLALLVGIDDYPGSEDNEVSRLRGCGKDVELVTGLLKERFGFAAREIKTLVGPQATHAEIVHQIDEFLIQQAGQDTKVVFWFSGHGSQIPDASGRDRALAENDAPKDQTMLAYDSRIEGRYGRYDLTDDEVHSLLDRIRARDVLVVTDCCHSGGISRGSARMGIRSAGEGSEPQDRELLTRLAGWPANVPLLDDDDRNRSLPHVVHITACAADQEAGETNTPAGIHGTLTWNLTQVLREAPSNASWRVVVESVRARIAGRDGSRANQFVDVIGDSTKAPLGGAALPTPAGYLVEPLGNGSYQLHAGSLQGIGMETEIEIRDQSGATIASCRPKEVGSVRTRFTPTKELPRDRPAWATLRGKLDGRAPLRVEPRCEAASEQLKGCQFAVAAVRGEAEYSLECGQGDLLQLRTIDGQLVANPAPANLAADLLFRESNFRSIWDAIATPSMWALELRIPGNIEEQPQMSRNGAPLPWAKVTKPRPGSAWRATTRPNSDGAKGANGLLVEIVNLSDTDLHIAVFALREDRQLRLIHGNDQNNELKAGQSMLLEDVLDIPPSSLKTGAAQCRYVAFATSRWVDFRSFAQQAPDVPRGDADLTHSLFMQIEGAGQENPAPAKKPLGIASLDLDVADATQNR